MSVWFHTLLASLTPKHKRKLDNVAKRVSGSILEVKTISEQDFISFSIVSLVVCELSYSCDIFASSWAKRLLPSPPYGIMRQI